jgi:predicted RNA-binding Zn-ribbon protein involved in translation (DUF1610 family)
MVFNCPTCGDEVRTRVLADSVTLVVIGHCADHGVTEVSRVYVGELDASAYPAEPTERVAYRPGPNCGRRIGESAACRLPIGHDEEHAA